MNWGVKRKFLMMLVLLGVLPSCSMLAKKSAGEWRTSPAVEMNQANVTSEIELLKSKHAVQLEKIVFRAGTAELDGPFHWKINMVGKAGVHQSMQVHGVQIKTQRTMRTASYPASMLGGQNYFVPISEKENESTVVASYTLPGELQLYPKADGKITVSMDLSITTAERTEREWVTFTLLPNEKLSKSFVFAPTTIDYNGEPAEWGNYPMLQASPQPEPTLPSAELEPLPAY